jgi:multiple sugar transport system permease protein
MALTAINRTSSCSTWKRSAVLDLNPTFKHISTLLFETIIRRGCEHDVVVSARFSSIVASVLAAYAIVRPRYRGAQWSAARSSWRIWCRRRSCSSAVIGGLRTACSTPFALILTYPTILIPFSTWLLMAISRPSRSSSRNAR